MKSVLFVLGLASVLLSVCGCLSCSVDPAVVSLWGGDTKPPTLVSVTPVSAEGAAIAFSGPVSVIEASACLSGSGGADLGAAWSPKEPSNSVRFDFRQPVPVGEEAVIDAVVKDASGNTLSFAVSFRGYNDRPARLAISEVRASYSKPKAEYVEFLVLESGNLSGIEIVNARNEKVPVMELPAAEAKAGEYVVLHLRSVDDGLVTELSALDESAGVDSWPTARDIWEDQTSAPLKPTNVILVRTRAGGPLQDALLMAESALTAWPTAACGSAADEASVAGAWPAGAGIEGAVRSDGMSPTRTLGRVGGGSWAVCPTGKCTPGRENWAP